MGKVQTVIVVAIAYLALAAFSAFFAYSDQDAWGVWLTSGLGLGLVLGRDRSDWWPVLAGAFLGAFIFEPLVGSSLGEALGFALIEVIVTIVGGLVAAKLSTPPLRFVVASRRRGDHRRGARTGADGRGADRPMGLFRRTP